MITVLYDGKCGLCSREIGHYMKICPKNVFVWQDIANEPEHLIKLKICLLYTSPSPRDPT